MGLCVFVQIKPVETNHSFFLSNDFLWRTICTCSLNMSTFPCWHWARKGFFDSIAWALLQYPDGRSMSKGCESFLMRRRFVGSLNLWKQENCAADVALLVLVAAPGRGWLPESGAEDFVILRLKKTLSKSRSFNFRIFAMHVILAKNLYPPVQLERS